MIKTHDWRYVTSKFSHSVHGAPIVCYEWIVRRWADMILSCQLENTIRPSSSCNLKHLWFIDFFDMKKMRSEAVQYSCTLSSRQAGVQTMPKHLEPSYLNLVLNSKFPEPNGVHISALDQIHNHILSFFSLQISFSSHEHVVCYVTWYSYPLFLTSWLLLYLSLLLLLLQLLSWSTNLVGMREEELGENKIS